MFTECWLSKEDDKLISNTAKGLAKRKLSFKETICMIISDKPEAIKAAEETIIHHRKQLESYIQKHPRFLYSLTPLEVDEDGPEIVRLMASASAQAGVGPMASVAGVLAELAVKEMLACGAKTAVVENGGEVSAVSETPIDVALLVGDSPLSGKLGFRIKKFPAGIATSSGAYGHVLSFGEAEAVTVFSKSAGLADAAATAICNIVRGENSNQAIERSVKKAFSIEGVEGLLIVYNGRVALAREVPELVNIADGG